MKKNGLIYITIAGLLWGTSGIFVNFLTPYGLSPMQITGARGTFALIAIGLYLVIFARDLFKAKWSHLPLFALSGLMMYVTSGFYYISINETSMATSVILMYTAPVYVIIFSVLFLGEKLSFTKIISILGVICGCALVSGVVGGMKFNLLGVVMGLASGITYSIYNIIVKVEMSKKANAFTATFYCYVFMALFSWIVTPPSGFIPVISREPLKIIILMAGLGIFTSCLPYFLYTLGLKTMPAGVAASLGVLEPLAATVYGVLFFNEELGIFNIIGIVLIVASVITLGKIKE